MATIYERRVKDIMSRDVVSLSAEDSIHEALTLLEENRISALPVVDTRNHCVGIFSTTDLVDMAHDVDEELQDAQEVRPSSFKSLIDKLLGAIGNERVAAYMTEDVTTVSPEATLARAAREMLRNRVHHLPVVDSREHLHGIVSTMDILAEFADGAPN